jgi:FixJ family two-component response regulator
VAGASAAPFHLVVTDVVLPGLSGPELAARLRLVRPEVRALFMSGYGQRAIVHCKVLDSSVVLLEKPFTSEQLLAHVRDALDGVPASVRGDG